MPIQMSKNIMLSLLVISLVTIGVALHAVPSQAQTGGWLKVYDRGVETVLLYDIDNDGKNEIVTNDFILDGKSVLTLQHSILAKIDYNGDGKLDLVQYVPETGKLFIITGGSTKTVTVYSNREARFFGHGLQIGPEIYAYNTNLVLPSNNLIAAPVDIDGKLNAVYIDNSGLVLYDGSKKTIIYPLSTNNTVIDAGYDSATKTLHVLVKSENSTAAIIDYNIETASSTIHIINYPINMGYYINGVFIGVSGTTVFELAPDKEPIVIGTGEKLIYPCKDIDSFALISAGEISLYKVENENATKELSLPSLVGVRYVDIVGNEAVATTSNGIYYYGSELPKLEIKAPPTVTVNRNFQVIINGSFTTAYVTIGGNSYTINKPSTLNIKVSTVGQHTLVVKACKGIYCITDTRTIIAMPRQLKIDVTAPQNVKPYTPFNITTKIYDPQTGKAPENTMCNIESIGENRIIPLTTPTDTVTLLAVPVGLEVPIEITCNGPEYGSISKTITIPVSEYYITANLTYKGGGKFIVYAYNKYTREPFLGTITVSVDGKNTAYIKNNGEFTIPPGQHTVSIKLVQNGITYGKYQYNVKYYDDISKAPPSEQIIVGDRVQYVTKYVNHTITRTVSKPVVIEKVNTSIIIGVLALGVGVGILFSYTVPEEWVRKIWERK